MKASFSVRSLVMSRADDLLQVNRYCWHIGTQTYGNLSFTIVIVFDTTPFAVSLAVPSSFPFFTK